MHQMRLLNSATCCPPLSRKCLRLPPNRRAEGVRPGMDLLRAKQAGGNPESLQAAFGPRTLVKIGRAPLRNGALRVWIGFALVGGRNLWCRSSCRDDLVPRFCGRPAHPVLGIGVDPGLFNEAPFGIDHE